jgi:hypothetical protein
MLHFDRLCVFTVHDRGREEGRKGGREEGRKGGRLDPHWLVASYNRHGYFSRS